MVDKCIEGLLALKTKVPGPIRYKMTPELAGAYLEHFLDSEVEIVTNSQDPAFLVIHSK